MGENYIFHIFTGYNFGINEIDALILSLGTMKGIIEIFND